MTSGELQLEQVLLAKLVDLKYDHRPDLRDRAALEANFRNHFQTLNQVKLPSILADAEFARLLDEIVTTDVFPASQAEKLATVRMQRGLLPPLKWSSDVEIA